MAKENVCKKSVVVVLSYPKIKDPRNTIKKARNSTNQAKIVIEMILVLILALIYGEV